MSSSEAVYRNDIVDTLEEARKELKKASAAVGRAIDRAESATASRDVNEIDERRRRAEEHIHEANYYLTNLGLMRLVRELEEKERRRDY